jgi:hypothetical protein
MGFMSEGTGRWKWVAAIAAGSYRATGLFIRGCSYLTRKWNAAGYGRALLIIQRVAKYLWLRLWGKADTAAMHRKYYGSSGK